MSQQHTTPSAHTARPAKARRLLPVIGAGAAAALVAASLSGCGSSAYADIAYDASGMSEGEVAFVPFGDESNGRLIVAMTDEGPIAKLDTCNSCNGSPHAYYEDLGDGVIQCQNCGFTFEVNNLDSSQGGCSPMDVKHSVDGDTVTVKAGELSSSEELFEAVSRK